MCILFCFSSNLFRQRRIECVTAMEKKHNIDRCIVQYDHQQMLFSFQNLFISFCCGHSIKFIHMTIVDVMLSKEK